MAWLLSVDNDQCVKRHRNGFWVARQKYIELGAMKMTLQLVVTSKNEPMLILPHNFTQLE